MRKGVRNKTIDRWNQLRVTLSTSPEQGQASRGGRPPSVWLQRRCLVKLAGDILEELRDVGERTRAHERRQRVLVARRGGGDFGRLRAVRQRVFDAGDGAQLDALVGIVHQALEGHGGQRAAGHVVGRGVVVVAEPDGGGVIAGEADIPGVAIGLRRARLATRDNAAVERAAPGGAADGNGDESGSSRRSPLPRGCAVPAARRGRNRRGYHRRS